MPDIKITETDTAVLQKCEDTWNKCNFPSDKWQDISGALKKRIALIKEYCAEDGTVFDKEQLTGGLEDIALEDIANEINFNSLAKDIFSTSADQSRRDDKTSI